MTRRDSVETTLPGRRSELRALTDSELEAALTLAATRRTIFDHGRLPELLAERERRRAAQLTPAS